MWCIYYGDSSTFGNEDGTPDQAPERGVQVIIRDDPECGWTTQSGADYYIWDERGKQTTWWGCDYTGMLLYLLKPGWKRVLFGEQIDNATYDEIVKQAMQTHPGRTARGRRERLSGRSQ